LAMLGQWYLKSMRKACVRIIQGLFPSRSLLAGLS
jgi:hypothetical protein